MAPLPYSEGSSGLEAVVDFSDELSPHYLLFRGISFRQSKTMKYALLGSLLIVVGCSSATPTAPSPPQVIVQPPVVVAPATGNPLVDDARFSLAFYRLFALGGGSQPLNRLAQAPSIYLSVVDNTGATVDSRQLDATAAALINVAASWTGGAFGLEGLERGTGATDQKSNRIMVSWSADTSAGGCGATTGRAITLYYRIPVCLCNNLLRARTVKHELGHALGYYHTFDAQDLMSGLSDSRCDQEPSVREIFHAKIAYSQPLGSLDPF